MRGISDGAPELAERRIRTFIERGLPAHSAAAGSSTSAQAQGKPKNPAPEACPRDTRTQPATAYADKSESAALRDAFERQAEGVRKNLGSPVHGSLDWPMRRPPSRPAQTSMTPLLNLAGRCAVQRHRFRCASLRAALRWLQGTPSRRLPPKHRP